VVVQKIVTITYLETIRVVLALASLEKDIKNAFLHRGKIYLRQLSDSKIESFNSYLQIAKTLYGLKHV